MATQITHPAERIESIDTSRFECIHGELIERPLPNLEHSRLQLRLTNLIQTAAKGAGLEALPELSLDESDATKSDWMTPDILVAHQSGFRTKLINKHVLPPVLLAVEILSPGQTFFNMRRKAELYMRWGVEHVWLVDQDSSTVLTFFDREMGEGRVLYFDPDSKATLSVEELFTIRLSEIFS